MQIAARGLSLVAVTTLMACGNGQTPRDQPRPSAAPVTSRSTSAARPARSNPARSVRRRALRPSPGAHGYKFLARPVVRFAYFSDGSPAWAAFLRLNKALPRERELILIDGRPYEAAFRSSIPSFCYTERADGAAITGPLKDPRDGKQVTVTVGLTDLNFLTNRATYLTAKVIARRVTLSQLRAAKPRLRRLGCKQPSN